MCVSMYLSTSQILQIENVRIKPKHNSPLIKYSHFTKTYILNLGLNSTQASKAIALDGSRNYTLKWERYLISFFIKVRVFVTKRTCCILCKHYNLSVMSSNISTKGYIIALVLISAGPTKTVIINLEIIYPRPNRIPRSSYQDV